MAVFNGERYVEEAVRSVLAQTEPDLELIAVNDGSTDATGDILSRLAQEDRRIRVQTQTNSGKASIPRNAGVALATGAFVAFIDGDDRYNPRLLERALEIFRQAPETGLVFSDYAIFGPESGNNGTGRLAGLKFLELAAAHLSPMGGNAYGCDAAFYNCLSTRAFGAVHGLTAVIRRELLMAEPVWFPEELTTYEDNDLWLRLALHTRFAYIHEILAYYRSHSGNTSSKSEEMAVGAIAAKTRNLARGRERFSPAEILYCRGVLAQHYLTLGYLQACRDDRAAARRSYWRSARVHPSGTAFAAILRTLLPVRVLNLARKHFGSSSGRRYA